jgi:branched-chain amino acid aminotransferase
VIEACAVVEDDLPLSALAGAPEAFLTSTTREVQPVRAVDGVTLPAAPCPLTTAAAAAFAAVMADDLDP